MPPASDHHRERGLRSPKFALLRELADRPVGSPPLTPAELAERTGLALAPVRSALMGLVRDAYVDNVATTRRPRYVATVEGLRRLGCLDPAGEAARGQRMAPAASAA